MSNQKGQKGSSRTGWGILLLLAGTLVPLAGSILSALLMPAAAGAISFAGYLLTIAGSVALLPDTIWFAATILCAGYGMAVEGLPLLYDNLQGEVLYILTGLAAAFCYGTIYGGLDRLLAHRQASASERALGLWWTMLFAASELLMYVCVYLQPRVQASMPVQILVMIAAFACAVLSLVFQIRYLRLARRRLDGRLESKI